MSAPGSPGSPDVPGNAPGNGPSRLPGPPSLRIAVGVLLVVMIFGVGGLLAVAERAGCLRRGPRGPQTAAQLPPPPAPDSAGTWLDSGDSLLGVDPGADPASMRRGFDLWARALSSMAPPSADSMPGLPVLRKLLDSMGVPAELARAPGDARAVLVTFRPRAAVRYRAPYLFYRLGGRIGWVSLQISNPTRVASAAWFTHDGLHAAAAGVISTAEGPRFAFDGLDLQGRGGWASWDSLPPADSLAGAAAITGEVTAGLDPGFVEQPGAAPLLVIRRPVGHGPFEECAACPRRYVSRIWRLGAGSLTFVTEQPEDSPYAALAGFLESLPRGRDEASRFAWDAAVMDAAEAQRLDAVLPEGSWRLQAGHTESDSVFLASRLGSDTFRFGMHFDGSRWRVGSVERARGAHR
ncbi:MAG: hypothetical protein HZB25_02790 [Candidatus Eisenbacteria bacterium]|nr:hypothetical protein [Candidatus Eisenbacteria bacterium]